MRVAEVAGRQWGVVSHAQLVELGAGRGAIERRLRTGRLHRLHRGVYAVGHRSVRWEGRALAAVLACGPGAVLSHRSAARHWGLLGSDATNVEVAVPASRRQRAGIRLHRSRSLDARTTTTHDGIPITTVARTLLDLAATQPAARSERAVAQAERLRLYDHRAVLAASAGHRGRARLLATADHARLTRSEPEARVLDLVRRTRLPEPQANVLLSAPDHPRLEVDLHWPAARVVVELDGFETHGTRAAFEADRARDAALQAAGFRVLRFTWRTDDATIARRLRAVL